MSLNKIPKELLIVGDKAIIDEKDDAARINQYVDMAQKSNEGEFISIDNPFDRSIAIAFELVIKNQLNPWDIDLVSFQACI
jgi:segregation and condensation protein A